MQTKKQSNKIRKVLREFKKRKLRSSTGKKVSNPKQALAIALSEAGANRRIAKNGKNNKRNSTKTR